MEAVALLQEKMTFDQLMVGRLCATLRHREPLAQIGGSILIYRLTDDDVRRALTGRPAEMLVASAVKGID